MEIYVVILEDRHYDTDVELFTSLDLAIARAKEIAKEHAGYYHTEPVEEKAGYWLYYSRFSSEGDNVHVIMRRLDVN